MGRQAKGHLEEEHPGRGTASAKAPRKKHPWPVRGTLRSAGQSLESKTKERNRQEGRGGGRGQFMQDLGALGEFRIFFYV